MRYYNSVDIKSKLRLISILSLFFYSHMDSSLDWDSIVFKELSFCMSSITEDLVNDRFPMKLLEDPMDVLADIKTELQVFTHAYKASKKSKCYKNVSKCFEYESSVKKLLNLLHNNINIT